MTDKLLSVYDVAQRLQISTPTVRSYVKRGLLVPDVHKELGKGSRGYSVYFFKYETVAAFLKAHATGQYYGERLFQSTDVSKQTGIPIRTLHSLIDRGVVKPDVILPDTTNGKSGRRRFTQKTIDAIILNSVWKPRNKADRRVKS